MLPTSSSTSNRSYTLQNSKPPGHRAPVALSSSLFGKLRNIVTAPLSWFAPDDDFEDTPGKRRRLVQQETLNAAPEDGGSRNKRMRVNSPEREGPQGYLDPPTQIFQQPKSAPPGSSFPQLPALASFPGPIGRSTSVTTPYTVQRSPRNNRHTVSPLRTSFTQTEIMSRTMSMDPPARQPSRGYTMTPSRDHSGRYSMSVPRDVSMSPTRGSFHMRTSLTPQPSGPHFGPSVQRRNSAVEPPTLEELAITPMFLRPPTEHSKPEQETPITLGCLVDSQRHTRSPVRQHSTLLFGPRGSTPDTNINGRPINAAEKALHELDIYKTPLLPSRLRGSTTIPDMFKPKPKRLHTPTLMHDREEKPKLGKAKSKLENGSKPYAGQGGMKRMLARRRHEEEHEKQQEKAEAMDDGRLDEEEEEVPPKKSQSSYFKAGTTVDKAEPLLEKEQNVGQSNMPPISRFDPTFDRAAGSPSTSLRVGRVRTSRNHIARPTSKPSHNRFSAAYEEEEDDRMGDEKSSEQIALEEAAKTVPAFNIPAGFTFAKETAQVQPDSTKAKEPPMASLPFSLSKHTPQPTISNLFAPKEETVLPFLPPSISFTAATPEARKPPPFDPPKSAAGVPNFFANSATLSKSASASSPPTGVPNFFANSAAIKPTIDPPPASSNPSVPDIFGAATAPSQLAPATFSFGPTHATPTKDADNPLWEGEQEKKTEEPKQVSTVGLPQPSASSLFGTPASNISSGSSLFGAGPTNGLKASLSGNGLLTIQEQVAPMPSAPAAAAAPPLFSFGAPAKTAEFPATPLEPPKVQEAPKPAPLFGTAPVASFAGFGPPAPTSTDSPKPVFTFGQPVAAAPASIEAPKPLFGANISQAPTNTFAFGQRPTSAPSAEVRASSASPFLFGAAPATPPTGAEKKPFAFGSSPAQPVAPPMASAFSFGPPSGGSNGADVSQKPFAFGAAPARPVTPPKSNDQEFRMEESPTREMTMKTEDKPAVGGFSFNPPGSSLFGQNMQPSQGASNGYSFCATSNGFGSKPDEKLENKSSGFGGFGQAAPSTGFLFGQKPADAAPTPSPGGFSFGQNTAPPPISTSSFGFGAPSITFSHSGSNAGSAPNSPSTFNQPAPFAFSSPTTGVAASNPFAFSASQPSSPANGHTSLPQAPSSSGGGFSFGQANNSVNSQTTSPFQAISPALPPTGGSLFTIGSAPPSAPPSGGGRPIKKMPNRKPTGGRR